MSIPMIGAFESTYLPAHDTDVTQTTGHDRRWREDIALLQHAGVRQLRYPVLWHRVEGEPGRYDWRRTDEVLGHLHDCGLHVIADLVHHTSYPRWLDRGFDDPRYGEAFLRFTTAVAERYPWLPAYTLVNEPFSTMFLAGHAGLWPPYLSGDEGFVRLLRNVLPPLAEASRNYRSLLPDARHVWTDTCESHGPASPAAAPYVARAQQRRFVVLDLMLGRAGAPGQRLYVDRLCEVGGADLLDMEPGHVDVLGLDYYAHCQWSFGPDDVGSTTPRADPVPLADQIVEYWERYRLPIALSETNVRGYASDRATWLKYTLEQCEIAVSRGVPVEGYCWFPVIDSADWNSLLHRCEGAIDPVGAYWLDDALERRESSMSRSWAAAAAGTPAAELPAYRLREPVATWLRGYLDHVPHWQWQDPPEGELCSNDTPPDARMELRVVERPVRSP